MNTVNPAINRFSWSRVVMVARYFYPLLRTQLILFPLVSLAYALSNHLLPHAFGISGLLNGLVALCLALMLWFASGRFAGHHRQCETMLPALWSEKALFVVVYSMIIVPAMLYLPRMIVDYAASLFTGGDLPLFALGNDCVIIAGYELGLRDADTYFAITTCLYVACRSPKSTFVKSAVWSLIATVVMGLVVGIGCLIVVSSTIFADPQTFSGMSGEQVFEQFGFGNTINIIYLISIAYSALMVFLTIRSFKKIQM